MNGILLVNKEKNYTSHDIVAITKKSLGKKIGHTGTLDPNATGVLPLLVGNATKICKYLVNHDKKYIATLKLGIKTDTLDGEGKVLQEELVDEKILQEENVKNVLASIVGKQSQVPPMYSAIKVGGKKLYEYARANKTVEIEPRQIELYSTKLINIDIAAREIVFEVECSKGTYIRTVCEDVAQKLGTIGYMKELNRTKVGDFLIENTVSIEDIKNYKENKEVIESKLITIENLFKKYNSIKLDNKKLELFLNGVKLSYNLEDGIYKIYNNNIFIGIGIVNNNLLKRDVII